MKTKTIQISDMQYAGSCQRDLGQGSPAPIWYAHQEGPAAHRYLEPWNGNTSAVVGKGKKVNVIDDLSGTQPKHFISR